MKIYDISQEVFSAAVYPGDPLPEKQLLSSSFTKTKGEPRVSSKIFDTFVFLFFNFVFMLLHFHLSFQA